MLNIVTRYWFYIQCFTGIPTTSKITHLPLLHHRLSPMSKPFKLNSAFRPSGDQPEAIRRLEEGLEDGLAHQTLLG